MKNDSVIENYQDDMRIIPPEIESMKVEEIVAQIKQIQATKYNTNVKNRKSTITLPVHLEEKVMVETDQIRIDKIQKKLRHRYMLLVGLNIIAYLTVIAFCIVGCNKIGGYSGNSSAFDEYWLYGGLAGLPGVFALLAFAVCIPSADTKKMSKKTQKNIKAAQVANAALQASVGNVTGAANSVSGAMGGTDGFFLGPRARFIAPLFIFGALFLMLGYPQDRIHHDIPEQEEWLIFMLLVLAEIFAIAAAMACRVYNRFKYYHTTDKKEADAEDKRITALQNERYRIECEKARELKKHKQAYKRNMEGNEILSEATEIDITQSKKGE